ncbi:MAG: hypothetical protein HKM06_04070 [Spirochaetales bacterium]|nr:hypothetical protein [Spirochaetales bacterium]
MKNGLFLVIFLVLTSSLWAIGGWVDDSWRSYTARSKAQETNLVLAEFKNNDGQVKTWGVFRRRLPDGSEAVWVATGDLKEGVWRAGWVELAPDPEGFHLQASGQLRAVLTFAKAVASLSSEKPTDLLEWSFAGPVKKADRADRELFSRCFADFQEWSASF